MARLNMTEQERRESDEAYKENSQIQALKRKLELRELTERVNKPLAPVASTREVKEKNYSIGHRTDLSIQAAAAVLYSVPAFPREKQAFANLAAKLAAELGITPPDNPLSSNGHPLRGVVQSFLQGIEAADKAG
jgi:hypothetical protein